MCDVRVGGTSAAATSPHASDAWRRAGRHIAQRPVAAECDCEGGLPEVSRRCTRAGEACRGAAIGVGEERPVCHFGIRDSEDGGYREAREADSVQIEAILGYVGDTKARRKDRNLDAD